MLSAGVDVFADLRAREFARLDEQNLAYLDYAASGLYAASQVVAYASTLAQGVFGNPHSQHGPSRASEEALSRARHDSLAFFDADPALYDVCFAANTSGAIKLVAESYPFGPSRGLLLSADNHNSVNGVREYARAAGAPVSVIPLTEALRLDDPVAALDVEAVETRGLLAFPVQSNFSGVRHPLSLVAEAQRRGYDVLLDAAGTGPLRMVSLREHPAEFLVFSFYKLFGLPTGLGALIARKAALRRLRRPWFAGGTVDFVSVEHRRHQLRDGHEGFEDGTPNFLDAIALAAGFHFLAGVDQQALCDRLQGFTRSFLGQALALKHVGGSPLLRIYGPEDMRERGCVVAFNILRPNGACVPFAEVEARALSQGVALRGGCFCNPGAAEQAFGFAHLDVAASLNVLSRDFTPAAFQRLLGPHATVGALRLSLGLPTNQSDLDRALTLIASFAQP